MIQRILISVPDLVAVGTLRLEVIHYLTLTIFIVTIYTILSNLPTFIEIL